MTPSCLDSVRHGICAITATTRSSANAETDADAADGWCGRRGCYRSRRSSAADDAAAGRQGRRGRGISPATSSTYRERRVVAALAASLPSLPSRCRFACVADATPRTLRVGGGSLSRELADYDGDSAAAWRPRLTLATRTCGGDCGGRAARAAKASALRINAILADFGGEVVVVRQSPFAAPATPYAIGRGGIERTRREPPPTPAVRRVVHALRRS